MTECAQLIAEGLVDERRLVRVRRGRDRAAVTLADAERLNTLTGD